MPKDLAAVVGDDYRCGIIDGAYRDPDEWTRILGCCGSKKHPRGAPK
jgi:hypothetical protein